MSTHYQYQTVNALRIARGEGIDASVIAIDLPELLQPDGAYCHSRIVEHCRCYKVRQRQQEYESGRWVPLDSG